MLCRWFAFADHGSGYSKIGAVDGAGEEIR
jgi:hypothetical protein